MNKDEHTMTSLLSFIIKLNIFRSNIKALPFEVAIHTLSLSRANIVIEFVVDPNTKFDTPCLPSCIITDRINNGVRLSLVNGYKRKMDSKIIVAYKGCFNITVLLE